MNAIVRHQLHALLTEHGHALCDEPKRCDAYLRERCPHARREVNLLMGALLEHVPTELLTISATVPHEIRLAELAQHLQARLGISDDLARWAVESWAVALELIEEADLSAYQLPGKLLMGGLPTMQDASWYAAWWEQLDPFWQEICQRAIGLAGLPTQEAFSQMLNLEEIACHEMPVRSLAPLRYFVKLQSLDCHQTLIRSLAPLRTLTTLQVLDCHQTMVRSLTPLNQLVGLQKLVCSQTRVRTLEPLRNLTQLGVLACEETAINSLEPLTELTGLHTLICRETQLTTEALNAFAVARPQCLIIR